MGLEPVQLKKQIQIYGFPFLGFLALAFLIYFPCIHGSFLWDDWEYIIRNPVVTTWTNPFSTWITLKQIDYWPLTYSVFWVLWRIFGDAPTGFHLVNLVFHAATATLVFALLRRFKIQSALLAAAIFLVHPVQVQTVAWIIQLKTLMSSFFLFFSLWLYLDFLSGSSEKKAYVLSLIAFVLALASKTSAAFLPFFLHFFHFLRSLKNLRKYLFRILPYYFLSISFIGITSWIYDRVPHRQTFPVELHDSTQRLTNAFFNGIFYIKKLCFPFDLAFIYSGIAPNRWDLVFFTAILSLGAFAGFRLIKKKDGRTQIELALTAIGFYLIGLLPALGLIRIPFMRFAPVADQWQYPSVLGFSMIAGMVLDTLEKVSSKKVSSAVAVVYIAALGSLTFGQSRTYESEAVLWKETTRLTPASGISWYNLGLTQRKAGEIDQSVSSFEKAVALEPRNIDFTFDLAAGYFSQNKLSQAAKFFRHSLQLDPNEDKAQLNLAISLIGLGDWSEAETLLKDLIQKKKTYAETYLNLGLCLVHRKENTQAEQVYADGLKFFPKNVKLIQELNRLRGLSDKH